MHMIHPDPCCYLYLLKSGLMTQFNFREYGDENTLPTHMKSRAVKTLRRQTGGQTRADRQHQTVGRLTKRENQ